MRELSERLERLNKSARHEVRLESAQELLEDVLGPHRETTVRVLSEELLDRVRAWLGVTS